MTVTTVSSVGYGEVHPLSKAGRAFTLVLIVAGLGTVLYGLSAITAFWVEGDLSHMWEKRKMERRIAALRDHVIVWGPARPAGTSRSSSYAPVSRSSSSRSTPTRRLPCASWAPASPI